VKNACPSVEYSPWYGTTMPSCIPYNVSTAKPSWSLYMGKRKILKGAKKMIKYSVNELNANRILSFIVKEARIPKRAKRIEKGKKQFAKYKKKSGVTETISYKAFAN
jgi:hypothetical protein